MAAGRPRRAGFPFLVPAIELASAARCSSQQRRGSGTLEEVSASAHEQGTREIRWKMLISDPILAARTLAVSTWRREFERNHELRERVHKEEVARFTDALKEELGTLPGSLHDDHDLSLSDDGRTLVLGERGQRGHTQPLARCYINTSNIGALSFQFFAGTPVEEEVKENLQLLRNWIHEYAWTSGARQLNAHEAAKFCLSRLLAHANSLVSREVANNPRLDAG
jgi:hypothetical protein